MLACGLAVNYVATEKAWAEKREAIETWLELALMAGEWANAHPEEAAQMMVDMFAIDGYETTEDYNYEMITDNPYIDLEENYGFFCETDETYGANTVASQLYSAMEGYVEMGNYSESQLESVMAADSFVPDPVISIYESRQ